MNPAPQFRIATVDDAKNLSETATALFIETYAEQIPDHEIAAYVAEHYNENQQQLELANPAMVAVLAEVGAEIVGFTHLAQKATPVSGSGADIELKRIYLAAVWHGKGVARELLRETALAARQYSGSEIWLAVWEENVRAIRFYTKVGFRSVGVNEFQIGSLIQRDVVMQAAVQDLL
jgi:ribosomal protein S18 acetylase RimI-like enzyme